MKLNGYFTVEASYIIPFITFLVVSIINLDMYLHDSVLSDACMVNGGIRMQQVDLFYYNNQSGHVNVSEIANSPVVTENEEFYDAQKVKVINNVNSYWDEKRIGGNSSLSDTDVSEVITRNDNANIVRAGGKLMNIIGSDDDEF